MDLPVNPPVSPMLAKSVKGVPAPEKVDGGFLYEPKWDGFRCIVFRDGDEVLLGSRNERPLTRYFPEVVAAAKKSLPERCVVDGEIFVGDRRPARLRALLERIHPADSRVGQAEPWRHPPLSSPSTCWRSGTRGSWSSLSERSARTPRAGDVRGRRHRSTSPPRPATMPSRRAGSRSFEGAGLDGVIAKPLSATYQPGVRAMLKVKHERTADVVVAGYRLHKTSKPERPLLGSLLLGLFDDDGRLQHVGVSAAFGASRRAELVDELEPLVVPPDRHPWAEWASGRRTGDRMPGGTVAVERRQGSVVGAARSR